MSERDDAAEVTWLDVWDDPRAGHPWPVTKLPVVAEVDLSGMPLLGNGDSFTIATD